jgi:hypothetical protein
VLRGTSADPSAATILQSYRGDEITEDQPIAYYDTDKTIPGTTQFYFLKILPLHPPTLAVVQGPIAVAIPPQGDTTLTAVNSPVNAIGMATVDSIDAGTSATVRIYGAAGVGTAWTRANGYGGAPSFPAGSITGLAYGTPYYVFWNGLAYAAFTSPASGVADTLIFAGKVQTVVSGGGGGISGGGGPTGTIKGALWGAG